MPERSSPVWMSPTSRYLSLPAFHAYDELPYAYMARRSCLVNSRGFAHLAALGLVSMMLHHASVKTVVLLGLTEIHKTNCSYKTGCSGEQRLTLHVLGLLSAGMG